MMRKLLFNILSFCFFATGLTATIEVVPYNPQWPSMYEEEAAPIKNTFDDPCVTFIILVPLPYLA